MNGPLRLLKKCWAFFFLPPFPGLPFLVWGFYLFAFVVHSHGEVWRYNFVDSDDYLYLVQAMDWLKGQNWYDIVQHRMNPPEGTPIHFSRLLNLLYGGSTLFFSHWYNLKDAATMTAAICPLLYLALFLWALKWAANPLAGKEWANVSALAALFSLTAIFQFMPGRVDHHGLMAAIAVLLFALGCRMVLSPARKIWGIAAGVLAAVAIEIGLEILPVFLVVSAWLGLWATVEDEEAAINGLAFGASLAATTVVLLAGFRPPSLFFDLNIETFSFVYVALNTTIGTCFLGAWLFQKFRLSLWGRIAGTGIVAFLLGLGFLIYLPHLTGGPYGDVDPRVRETLFHYAGEAWPLTAGGYYAKSIVLPILALLSLAGFWRIKNRQWLWMAGALLALITFCFGLAISYQERMMVFTEAFAAVALSLFIKQAWTYTARFDDDILMRRMLRVAAFLLIGPLTVWIPFTMLTPKLTAAGAAFFPTELIHKSCDQNGLEGTLNTTYGNERLIIMTPLTYAAELLFRTPDAVIGAPFHMNVQGILDTQAFFESSDPDVAHAIARKRGVDLVVLCHNLDASYYGDAMHWKRFGGWEAVPSDNETFAVQLLQGEIPDWLKPISSPELGNMMLFKVVKS